MKTNNIHFRPLTTQDSEHIYTLSGNPAVAKYMRFDTHTSLAQATALLEEYLQHGGFAVEIDNAFGGIFSFNNNEDGDYGMSTFLGEEHWNKGCSTQILKEMIAYSKNSLGAKSLTAHVVMDNLGSRRVLEKNGFEVIDIEVFPDWDGKLYVYKLTL